MNARTKRWVLVIALFALPACGGRALGPSEPIDFEAESPVELENEQQLHFEQFTTALGRTELECERICELSELICDLSDRICGIAERHPGDTETGGRCRDAAARCDRGRERIPDTCPCEL